MDITLYKNHSSDNVIDKNLSEISVLRDCKIKSSENIININVILKTDITIMDCNYLFISELNKYYFIRNVQVNPTGIYNLSCEIDVLYTYRDLIKKLNAVCIETSIFDDYLQSNTYDVLSTLTSKSVTIPFDKSVNDVLTVTMGDIRK